MGVKLVSDRKHVYQRLLSHLHLPRPNLFMKILLPPLRPSHSFSIESRTAESIGEVILVQTGLGYLANSTKLRLFLSLSPTFPSHIFKFRLHTTDSALSFTVSGQALIRNIPNGIFTIIHSSKQSTNPLSSTPSTFLSTDIWQSVPGSTSYPFSRKAEQ